MSHRLAAIPPVLQVVAAMGLLLLGAHWVAAANIGPEDQADLSQRIVYAYRQWQSTGLYLKPGDTVKVQAAGQWLYSPVVGLHGPEGGRPAPRTYPDPDSLGGALLGRIGEAGQAFGVGRNGWIGASGPGTLYLMINDDRLGDNRGEVRVRLTPYLTSRPDGTGH